MDRHEAELDDGCRGAGAQTGGPAWRLPRAVRAVVFDLDGTLLDTEHPYRAAFHAALAELGWALPDSSYGGLIGLPGTARRALLPRLLGPSFPVADFFACYARHRDAALSPGVSLKPGVQDVLDALEAAGVACAVATSASARTARANLAAAGLLHRLPILVTRDDVACGKPHPESFLQAARHLGQAPPDCLAVEDSAPGVAAAHAAGMMVVTIPDAVPPTPAMLSRAAVLCSLHDVAALLDRQIGELGRMNHRSPIRV